ncbi:hypothetical protein B0H14DRAFT_3579154 [Mycena olivaceomarginata]|nr:hypothetical protein B0H14DRAFT_3579154 [Mycena olivaceomarginata]
MHTRPALGIDGDLAQDLENPITWIPPLSGNNNDGNEDEEDIVQKAYDDLQRTIADEGADSNRFNPGAPQPSIVSGEIIDFVELDRVDRGETDAPAKEAIEVIGDDAPGS